MKRHFFLLFCAVVTANLAFAQSSASVSPDMARHEINAGKVKRIVYFNNGGSVEETINFSPKGEEKKAPIYKKQQLKRDDLGRLVFGERIRKLDKTFEDPQYFRTSLAYVGNELCPQLEEWKIFLSIDDSVFYRRNLSHCIYGNQGNAPLKEFAYSEIEGLYLFFYTEYKYLEFDENGNWTKREIAIYQTDVVPEEGDMAEYYSLLKVDIPLSQRDVLESKLAQYFISSAESELEYVWKYTETRQIEYYK